MVTTVTSSWPTPLPLSLKTWAFPDGTVRQAGSDRTTGSGWASRRMNGTDIPVTAAIVSRVLPDGRGSHADAASVGGDGRGATANFTVPANGTVQIVHVLLTSYTLGGPTQHVEPLPTALRAAAEVNVPLLMRRTAGYWSGFWNRSRLALPAHPLVEGYWYRSQYLMAAASREGRVPPGLWGPWVSTDSPAWSGGFTLDYNFEMPFQGLYSSNHADVARSYYPEVLAYARRNGGAEAAANGCSVGGGVEGLPGAVHFAVQLAPGGLRNYANSLGINSNAAFAALNFVSAFEFSQNATWLREVSYPLLRAVAAWWVCTLKKTPLPGNAGYVYDDVECTREGCYNGPGAPHTVDTNPAIVIAFARRILGHLLDVAGRGLVSPPAAELAAWTDRLNHLAPIPTGKALNRTVLLPQAAPVFTFPAEERDNPLEFYAIWPGEQIGLSSPPALLEAAQNTVMMAQVTQPLQGNGFQEIFPAFVRAGINATTTLETLAVIIAAADPPNGYLAQGGGGIETAGATVAVNDMLLQSWEGFLRFFPVWPRGDDAIFAGLRAVGAFIVSAELQNGTIAAAAITSEVGGDCTVRWPWSATLAVIDTADGTRVPTRLVTVHGVDHLWRFSTLASRSYVLSQQS